MAPTPPPSPRRVKKHYSPHKRTRISSLYSAGVAAKAIASLECVPVRSVYAINARYKIQKSGQSRPGRGALFKLQERDKRHIMRLIQVDPFVTCAELAAGIGGLVCSRTITNWLKSEGIMHQRALRRPKLTARNAAKRLAFAKMHVRKPPSYWKRWKYSDESTVARGDGEKVGWVFCRRDERLLPQNVQPRAKPTRHSQMFWGLMGWNSRSPLIDLYGDPDARYRGITSVVILEVLSEILPQFCPRGSIFVMDNAPTHKARLVMDWLIPWAESNGVTLVDWPPYSPDLNPIENLWKLLKERICAKRPELADMPKNARALELLVETANEVWEEFEDEMLNNLAMSMENRLQAVIDAKGWYTKY